MVPISKVVHGLEIADIWLRVVIDDLLNFEIVQSLSFCIFLARVGFVKEGNILAEWRVEAWGDD